MTVESPLEPRPGAAAGVWTAPECPFTVLYDARVLDDIRLAVVDAFFSLPRGGAEIGGVLFGTHDARSVRILAHEPLECEHAFGPSFTLSDKDRARLLALLASTHASPRLKGMAPVGWYHSHTRSEIFLSDADVAVYNRYFPEAWHVALVLKPSTFKPTRAGFFFRQANGAVHQDSSLREFSLDAVAVQPPSMNPKADAAWREHTEMAPPPAPERELLPLATAEAAAAAPAPAAEVPAPEPDPAPEPAVAIPRFAMPETGRHSRRLMWTAVCAGAALMLSLAAYQLRDKLPRYSSGATPQASVGLLLTDLNGQLQIHWDRASSGVREAQGALLEIGDGGASTVVQLDGPRIRTGSFTYARRGDRVEVRLWVQQADGKQIQEYATFIGKMPPQQPAAEDPQARAERDALAREAARLKSDLGNQASRTRKLEKSLEDMRNQLRREQQRRREDRNADPLM